MAKEIDYSFKILEEILTLKKYSSREEVMTAGQVMVDIADKHENCSDKLKESYHEAYKKLDTLSFEEMNEIIDILSSYDDED
jgi:hypothetical protein